MTREDKELLFKDLCARLPYGVKCHVKGEEDAMLINSCIPQLCAFSFKVSENAVSSFRRIEDVRPYLLPFSSMGPAEYVEFVDLGDETSNDCFGSFNFDQLDWLNAHHFDYRRLIEKGLALDATGLNIY